MTKPNTFFTRALFLLALIFSTNILFARPLEMPGNRYLYQIKVSGVNDPVSFKYICGELDPIFDGHARFNDAEDLISIASDFDISKETLIRKITRMGYTLISYQKVTDDKTPK